MNAAPFFCIRIADIGIRVHSQDPQILISCDLNYAQFLSTEDQSDIDISVDCSSEVFPEFGELLFDSGRTWKIFRDDKSYRFAFYSPAYGTDAYRIALANSSFNQIQIQLKPSLIKPSNVARPIEYPLDELIVQGYLSSGNGAEVHSCGIQDQDGNGFIFIGQSGAGKTTTAKIAAAKGLKILSDDRIIIRKNDFGFQMFGTPWHGEAHFALPESANLRGIFFLKQAPEFRLFQLPKADTSARLYACSFPPYYNRQGIDFMLEFFENIASSVPSYELAFLPEDTLFGFLVGKGIPVSF